MKNKWINIILAIVFLINAITLGLSVRGRWGNPSETELNTARWKEEGPFELSPERGRFALIYSVIENKSFSFSLPLARFTVPDLGYLNDNYVSLFAPGLSLITAPAYLLGKRIGGSQVFSFGMMALLAMANLFLIIKISQKLGAGKIAGGLAGMMWLFGTPAFSYAVNLYQHHLSTMIILLSISAYINLAGLKKIAVIWLLIGVSFWIDYPNIILLAPLALATLGEFFRIKINKGEMSIGVRPGYVLGFLAIVLPIAGLAFVNQRLYQNPWQLAGSVSSARSIGEDGKPVQPDKIEEVVKLNVTEVQQELEEKNVLEWFQTRDLLNGFNTLLISPDRGSIVYALGTSLLGISGFFVMYKKRNKLLRILMGIVVANLVLYSMWGDPWGGWAFGSRYLIPGYAVLAISGSVLLGKTKNWLSMGLMAIVLFSFSSFINTAGAVSSNSNPPLPEVLRLEQISKKEEKYTVARNLDLIGQDKIKAAVYQETALGKLDGSRYFGLVYGLTLASYLILTITYLWEGNNEKK